MRVYVDFAYYKNQYCGQIDESFFNNLNIEVGNYLRLLTFNRIDELEEIPDEIKWCSCKLIDMIYKHENSQVDGKDVVSVSNDGYSVNYADPTSADFRTNLIRTALLYLPKELTSVWSSI